MNRGKILRDTNAGPGLIFINNEQKTFTLEGNWKSSVPPKVGGIVEVVLNEAGDIVSLSAIDESVIAKEQAQKALGIAQAQGKEWFGVVVAKVGLLTLVLIAVLTVAFLFLSTINVQVSSTYKESITFYDVLKAVNTSAGLNGLGGLKYASAGIYGFLLFVALGAPLLPHFFSNKYMNFGYCAPVVYMIAIFTGVYMTIRDGINQATGMANSFGGGQGAAMAEKMMSEMLSMTMKALSMGMGFYVAAGVSSYLAFMGIKKYLVSTSTV